MAITSEQRELRRKFIGSSDVAALFGLDPFKTAGDVYLDKVGALDPDEGSDATDRGTLLEPAVLDWAERKIGLPFMRGIFHANGDRCANFDGIHDGLASGVPPFIVEAKTTTDIDGYGDPDTDEIPDRVLIQVAHQMGVAGEMYGIAYVPVLMPAFGRFEFRMYRVPRNDELVDVVAERAREFKRKHVDTRTPPPESLPSLDVLKRVRRQPNKIIPVPDELVDAVVMTRAARKDAEESCKDAEVALLTALGDAEQGDYSRGAVTYMETKRKGYTVEATTFRSLRIKASK